MKHQQHQKLNQALKKLRVVLNRAQHPVAHSVHNQVDVVAAAVNK
jgi:hypothetical protein